MTANEPGAAPRLEAALSQWAASVALPADAATRMLTAILATPAPNLSRPDPVAPTELPASWWGSHAASLAATLVRSTRPLSIAA